MPQKRFITLWKPHEGNFACEPFVRVRVRKKTVGDEPESALDFRFRYYFAVETQTLYFFHNNY